MFSCQGLPRVEPYCNYRTEPTGNADWYWTITETDDVMTIDCEQKGYVGFTPKSAGAEVATGCLDRGRLHAFAIGDQPLRACRFHETQISIPAAMGQ